MKHFATRAAGAAIGVLLAATACGGSGGTSPTAAADKSEACRAISAKYPTLQGKTLTVGSSPGPANYVAPDPKDPLKVIGVEPDILAAVGNCVGFTTKFQKLDFNGLIPAMQAGRLDFIASGMYASDERAKQVSFVQYMTAGEASVVPKGNPKNLKSMDDTCGVTAAEAVGTVENAIFDKQSKKCEAAGKPPIKALSFQSNDQAMNAVSQGRADIFLTDSGVASYLAGRFDKVEVGFPIPSDFVFGIAVKKKDATLLNALNEAMGDLYRSGELKKLVTKWGFTAEQVRQPEIKA